jgi:hypothetical protein
MGSGELSTSKSLYTSQNNTNSLFSSFTSPNTPPVNYPEGFQGNEIPIDGEAVAKLVHHRLAMNEELDD